jgi:hypothetical protein
MRRTGIRTCRKNIGILVIAGVENSPQARERKESFLGLDVESPEKSYGLIIL